MCDVVICIAIEIRVVYAKGHKETLLIKMYTHSNAVLLKKISIIVEFNIRVAYDKKKLLKFILYLIFLSGLIKYTTKNMFEDIKPYGV